MLAIARLWDYLDADGWVGVVAVLSIAVGLMAISSRLRRPLNFMIAEFRTLTVLLVMEEDGQRYARIRRAVSRPRDNAGNSNPASNATTAKTVSNSINVNARRDSMSRATSSLDSPEDIPPRGTGNANPRGHHPLLRAGPGHTRCGLAGRFQRPSG